MSNGFFASDEGGERKHMKRAALVLVLMLGIGITGCGRKQESLQEAGEPISMEALSKLTLEGEATADVNNPQAQAEAAQNLPLVSPELGTLVPSGPYKPTAQEIQLALKNAGYYSGVIDGKIGPQSKKAIEEFQKANSLKVDGKVGPKTWGVLSKYLSPQLAEPMVIPVKKKR